MGIVQHINTVQSQVIVPPNFSETKSRYVVRAGLRHKWLRRLQGKDARLALLKKYPDVAAGVLEPIKKELANYQDMVMESSYWRELCVKLVLDHYGYDPKQSPTLVSFCTNLKPHEGTTKCLFMLLGDSGMGKTLTMQKIFTVLQQTQATFRGKYDLVFLYAETDLDKQVAFLEKNISEERKPYTIVFIDDFHKDLEAKKEADKKKRVERLKELLEKLETFAYIFCSTRTNFLFDKIDDAKDYKRLAGRNWRALFLDKIVKDGANRLLKNRLSGEYLAKAETFLAGEISTLFYRPLFIKSLIFLLNQSQEDLAKIAKIEVQVLLYEHLFKGWVRQERAALGLESETEKEKQAFAAELKQELLVAVVESFPKEPTFSKKPTELTESFFKRSEQSEAYQLAHTEFYEYFLAEALYQGRIAEEYVKKEGASEQSFVFYRHLLQTRLYFRPQTDKEWKNLKQKIENFSYQQEIKKSYSKEVQPLLKTCPNEYFRTLLIVHSDTLKDRLTKEAYYFEVAQRLYALLKKDLTEAQKEHTFWQTLMLFESYQKNNFANLEKDTFLKQIREKPLLELFVYEYLMDELLFSQDEPNYRDPYFALSNIGITENLFQKAIETIKRYNVGFALELAKITDLNLSGLDLTHTDWLKHFPACQRLNLKDNRLRLQTPTDEKAPDKNQQKYAALAGVADPVLALQWIDLRGNSIVEKDNFLTALYQKAQNPEEAQKEPLRQLPTAALIRIWYNMIFVQGTDACPEKHFLMGSKKGSHPSVKEDEYDQNGNPIPVSLTDFYLCRYQTTYADFEAFANHSGYQTDAEKGSRYFDYKESMDWFRDAQGKIDEEKKGAYILKKEVQQWGYIFQEKDEEGNVICWKHDEQGRLQTQRNKPVIYVSWNDAKACTEWLNDIFKDLIPGATFQLPSEAQWEYAAKGGINWKDDFLYAGSNDLNEVGYYYANTGREGTFEELEAYQKGKQTPLEPFMRAGSQLKPVGEKKPNQLGLYDMSGNVFEWCQDYYDAKFYETEEAKKQNPLNNKVSAYRLLRGGSWNNVDGNCHSAGRDWNLPAVRSDNYGFRFSLSP
ncbi:SUMF1/EgtB/PvdO family nonheme iron enzyme [Hugenholtzia roseola]|uniref:SUMF1/EgtB/PvdO family nonheme iron enzyme n=1 Tax=Hugenholtzia roseola TaxID=1002 RepID=UPI0003F937C3|nr:SUMF1/EgtB/PvdO family nonheme iron enzyme [Hugenholtzia roseola]